MTEQAQFSYPTTVDVGAGSLSRIPAHVATYGSKPFIVTDAGIAGLPIFQALTRTLDDASIPWSMTDQISPNPMAQECERAAQQFRSSGCDLIIGFGGGSALDGAKGVALMANHTGRIVDYDDALGGYDRIEDNIPPMLCVPTTAGTGSEVGRSTVVIDEETNRKVVVFSPYLMPKVALLDPELMIGLPAHITAATGFDALTHNLEALIATGYHPLCDAMALEGLSLCHQHLQRAYHTPSDLEARQGMAVAALMGATAFQKGLGAAHSLAHPLSTCAGMHHGLANAIVLPYVIEFNRPACSDIYNKIERALDLKTSLTSWILDLRSETGIPHTLQEADVPLDLVEAMTAQAYDDGCHATNPRKCAKHDLHNLYLAAFSGGEA